MVLNWHVYGIKFVLLTYLFIKCIVGFMLLLILQVPAQLCICTIYFICLPFKEA
jgi:hypothetical protein